MGPTYPDRRSAARPPGSGRDCPLIGKKHGIGIPSVPGRGSGGCLRPA